MRMPGSIRRCARNAIAMPCARGWPGAINALCSDHTPVDDDAKQMPFDEAEPGATGLELLLPLTLKWAREIKLPLVTALARVTSDPARILGIKAGQPDPVAVKARAGADVCVFDPGALHADRRPPGLRRHARLRCSRRLHFRENLPAAARARTRPSSAWNFPAVVRYTLIDGHLAFDGTPDTWNTGMSAAGSRCSSGTQAP
jgi:dihydroorotase